MKTFEPGQDVNVLLSVPEEPCRKEWVRAKYVARDMTFDHEVLLSDGTRRCIQNYLIQPPLPLAEIVGHFDCGCHALRHTVRFGFDPEEGSLSVSFHLATWLPWYRRVWLALKYAFGSEAPCAVYDETLIRPEDYRRLRGLIERAERFEMEQVKP